MACSVYVVCVTHTVKTGRVLRDAVHVTHTVKTGSVVCMMCSRSSMTATVKASRTAILRASSRGREHPPFRNSRKADCMVC